MCFFYSLDAEEPRYSYQVGFKLVLQRVESKKRTPEGPILGGKLTKKGKQSPQNIESLSCNCMWPSLVQSSLSYNGCLRSPVVSIPNKLIHMCRGPQ